MIYILKNTLLLLVTAVIIIGSAVYSSEEARKGNYDDIYIEKPITIPGLANQSMRLDGINTDYKDGKLIKLYMEGTLAYVIKPTGKIDPQRHWVCIIPPGMALSAAVSGKSEKQGEQLTQPTASVPCPYQYYVDGLLAQGFHVVGIEVGISCGSPAGVEIYNQFYKVLIEEFHLNPKGRFIGQSNGGLIAYAWAFRNPEKVDRIFGIFPSLDLRSWPRIENIGLYIPEGLSFNLSTEEIRTRLKEFNPIDNLEPLAKHHVKIFHVHGDRDTLVPIGPYTIEAKKRYDALGGQFEYKVINGGGHEGTPQFYACEEGLDFLFSISPNDSSISVR